MADKYRYRLTIKSTGNESSHVAHVQATGEIDACQQIYSRNAHITYAEGREWIIWIKSQLVAHVEVTSPEDWPCPSCGLIEGCHTSSCPNDPDKVDETEYAALLPDDQAAEARGEI